MVKGINFSFLCLLGCVLLASISPCLGRIVRRSNIQCQSWKSSEIRCGKDDWPSNRIKIINKSSASVTFVVDQWISSCGWPGSKYSSRQYTLNSYQNIELQFAHASGGKCREMFIIDCRQHGTYINCLHVLKAYPVG
uniref:Endotoxin-binding protein-protease inhibitor n=1 Tax=Limulus polyphemus TaxID=6850 RepID=Q25387_LIMPO|nr:endotoxin-binding protein-protease inhibitor [Limulus polyphemus]